VIGEANQVISLVENMRLIYFPDSFLVVENLYGSLLVNTEVSFAIDLCLFLEMISLEVFQHFFVNKKISKIPEKTVGVKIGHDRINV